MVMSVMVGSNTVYGEGASIKTINSHTHTHMHTHKLHEMAVLLDMLSDIVHYMSSNVAVASYNFTATMQHQLIMLKVERSSYKSCTGTQRLIKETHSSTTYCCGPPMFFKFLNDQNALVSPY